MSEQSPKHEYEVRIVYTEVHMVFVEADDWESAEELALDKYYKGETEIHHMDTEANINWSDEED